MYTKIIFKWIFHYVTKLYALNIFIYYAILWVDAFFMSNLQQHDSSSHFPLAQKSHLTNYRILVLLVPAHLESHM